MKTFGNRKTKRGVCFSRVLYVIVSLGLLGCSLCGTSFAAPADFPNKEITIIVAFGPGGARDILARGVGNGMTKHLGVPMVVSNMPGAGGARGLISLYHAAADGHTIGVGSTADVISQVVEKQEFDVKKFTYLGNAQHAPPIWFVRSDSPFRTVKDFKNFGKTVRHSTTSVTLNPTVAAMILSNREGFPLSIVAGYKSTAEAVIALIRGEVEFCSAATSVAAQYIRTGQIRPILVLGEKRSEDYPDTPTIVEMGQPDLGVLATDYWFMAPPGVPKVRVQILQDALMKTLKDPDFLKWAKGADVDPKPLSGEETGKAVSRLFDLLEKYRGDIEKHMK